MRIWPAIDILDGQCVRLTQGDYQRKTIYGKDPADMAARWIADGATCIHLVDLDGARDGSSINRQAVAEIVVQFDVEVQLGGGIRNEETINQYLEMGVQRLVMGTKALKDRKWFSKMCQKYPQRLIASIDARENKLATDGWLQLSDYAITDVAKELAQMPIAGLIYTDINRDGMMSGPNFDAYTQMTKTVDVPVIASGGVTTTGDVAALSELDITGCIIGKSLYEGKLTLSAALKAVK